MSLEINNLHFSYGERKVLDGVSFGLEAGSFVCLLGANGSGKSTLFSCILQFLSRYEGSIKLNGTELSELSTKERAKKIAYIPQSHIPVFNFTCLEVVLMATQSNGSIFYVPDKEADEAARDALRRVGLDGFEVSGYATISGDER